MGTTVTKKIPEGVVYGGGKILSQREEIRKKYDLLSVRTVYNPINYIKFKYIFLVILNQLKKEEICKNIIIHFDKLKLKYKKNDYLSMIYVLSTNKGYDVDWERDFIKITHN